MDFIRQRITYDPVEVMPDRAWEKVLSNLDGNSLKNAMLVSKEWSKSVSTAAKKRDDIASHPKPERVASLNQSSLLLFILGIWILSVNHWTFVVDYVRMYRETGFARVLVAYRVMVPILVLCFPFGYLVVHGGLTLSLVLVQILELSILLLPGFRKIPRFSNLLLFLTTVVLLRLDHVLLAGVGSKPFFMVPVALSHIIWSMFVQRAPLALASTTQSGDPSMFLPMFFVPQSLVIRSLRIVGWIICSLKGISNTHFVMNLAMVVVFAMISSNRSSLSSVSDLVRVVPICAVVSVVVQLVIFMKLNVYFLLHSILFVSCVVWIVSNFSSRDWFEGDILKRAKMFRILAIISILLIPTSLFV